MSSGLSNSDNWLYRVAKPGMLLLLLAVMLFFGWTLWHRPAERFLCPAHVVVP